MTMPTFLIATLASVAFMILYPIAAGAIAHRQLQVKWRYFAYGALIFFIFQGLTRIPAVQLIQLAISDRLQAQKELLWAWLITLALTAGIFEEVGRYLGYRFLMRREPRTWSKAVMFGLGHGGIEAMVLTSGLTILTFVQVHSLLNGGLDQLPPEQRARAADQLQTIVQQPWLFPAIAAFERLWTLPIHVALSVLVLQVFLRNSLMWLWLAIGAHALVDLSAVSLPQLLGPTTSTILIVEAVVMVWGLIGLWTIWRLRDHPQAATAEAHAPEYLSMLKAA